MILGLGFWLCCVSVAVDSLLLREMLGALLTEALCRLRLLCCERELLCEPAEAETAPPPTANLSGLVRVAMRVDVRDRVDVSGLEGLGSEMSEIDLEATEDDRVV